LTIAFASTQAFATGPQYRGTCAHAAEKAAYKELLKIDLGPEGDSVTLASKERSAGSDEYTVLFAIFDGNQSNQAKYTVTFKDLESCKKAMVAPAR
jgi:hypothetical protein